MEYKYQQFQLQFLAVMRRRVAQKATEKEAQMFEPAGRVSALPVDFEQRSVPAQRADESGSLFFAYFLWRDKESECAAGRISRQVKPHRASQKSIHFDRPLADDLTQHRRIGLDASRQCLGAAAHYLPALLKKFGTYLRRAGYLA